MKKMQRSNEELKAALLPMILKNLRNIADVEGEEVYPGEEEIEELSSFTSKEMLSILHKTNEHLKKLVAGEEDE